ncbi:MAG: transcription termination/antitermination protein NusA [Vampirovibrio sp.]|jgi:N utilization substance protein A|nr:transcription termination/antitermination protein NusA [Vampirovibrio sp.]
MMMMIKVGAALIEYAEQLERERGIPKQFILDSLKEAMLAAYRRYAQLPNAAMAGFSCKLVEKTGEIGIFQHKVVVEEVTEIEEPEIITVGNLTDEEVEALAKAVTLEAVEGTSTEVGEPEEEVPAPRYEISLVDARKLKADIQLGQEVELEVTPAEFGRIAAQSAKQVIMQRIREAERLLIQQEFEEKKFTVVPGLVQRREGRNVIVNIGRNDAILPPKEQVLGDEYRVGNKLRVYVQELKDSARMPQIIVSQADVAMVREVFELEVPEIEDGLVEIKAIAREAGHRTKVAVHSPDPEVDPQGACIGTRGSRIQAIVAELKNEKIDIIRWSENTAEFIANALAPSRIFEVRLHPNPELRKALIIVPDDQLSLAIGKEGQNVRLAAKLTGFKLDIKSYTQFMTLRDEVFRQQRLMQEQTQANPAGNDDNADVAMALLSEPVDNGSEAEGQ